MNLVPQVTELMLAEFLYLQYDNPDAPVYMYINSTGVQVPPHLRCPQPPDRTLLQKGGEKLGYESEVFAIYDTMMYVKSPIYTICVGTAFGEPAVLLSAGEKVRSLSFVLLCIERCV